MILKNNFNWRFLKTLLEMKLQFYFNVSFLPRLNYNINSELNCTMFLERNWRYVRSAKTILLLVPIKVMGAHYIIIHDLYWHNFNKAT